MKLNKKTILISLGMMLLLIIGGCTYYKTNSITSDKNTLIDTEDKAVDYAQKDTEVRNFLKDIQEKNFTLSKPWATTQDNGASWRVVFCAKDVMDLCYGLSFNSDGTIINRQDSFA